MQFIVLKQDVCEGNVFGTFITSSITTVTTTVLEIYAATTCTDSKMLLYTNKPIYLPCMAVAGITTLHSLMYLNHCHAVLKVAQIIETHS